MSACGWIRCAAVAAVVLGGCKADGRDAVAADAGVKIRRTQTDPSAEDYEMPPLPKAQVILEDAFGGKHLVEVEVAADEPSRTRGMMWRTSLDPGKGMLFVFGTERVQSFWMRNTLIPLDMLFINAEGVVVGIVHDAAPRTLTSRSVGIPSKYVLEVPGGWAERHGIREGSRVEFRGLSMIDVR